MFETQIGFDRWVVATSSKKLALEAWDVTRDLFADGDAAQTDDPKAIAVALSNIGRPVAMPRPKAQRATAGKAKAAKPKRKT